MSHVVVGLTVSIRRQVYKIPMTFCVDRDTDAYQAVEQDQRKTQQTIQQQDRLTIFFGFLAQSCLCT